MVLTYRRHDDDGRRDRHFRWIGDNPPAIKKFKFRASKRKEREGKTS